VIDKNEIRTSTGPFAMIPFWLVKQVFNDQIKPSAMVVYMALLSFADDERECWPSTETLTE